MCCISAGPVAARPACLAIPTVWQNQAGTCLISGWALPCPSLPPPNAFLQGRVGFVGTCAAIPAQFCVPCAFVGFPHSLSILSYLCGGGCGALWHQNGSQSLLSHSPGQPPIPHLPLTCSSQLVSCDPAALYMVCLSAPHPTRLLPGSCGARRAAAVGQAQCKPSHEGPVGRVSCAAAVHLLYNTSFSGGAATRANGCCVRGERVSLSVFPLPLRQGGRDRRAAVPCT